jgi:hypothetical protein
MGPDGPVQRRVDLRCDDDDKAIELASNLLTGATLSFGNWID